MSPLVVTFCRRATCAVPVFERTPLMYSELLCPSATSLELRHPESLPLLCGDLYILKIGKMATKQGQTWCSRNNCDYLKSLASETIIMGGVSEWLRRSWGAMSPLYASVPMQRACEWVDWHRRHADQSLARSVKYVGSQNMSAGISQSPSQQCHSWVLL